VGSGVGSADPGDGVVLAGADRVDGVVLGRAGRDDEAVLGGDVWEVNDGVVLSGDGVGSVCWEGPAAMTKQCWEGMSGKSTTEWC